VDALPPAPPPHVSAEASARAPGDIYPRGAREAELCERAGRPDWLYLAGLAAVDVAAVWFSTTDVVNLKYSGPTVDVPAGATRGFSLAAPVLIGVAWGATIGGAWLAVPKCSMHWVGEPPPEGSAHEGWPLAVALALVAGATAPVISAIAIGTNLPADWTTFEREVHVVAAGLAGFGGALLPYWLPPRTWTAARELEHLRLGVQSGGGIGVGYSTAF